MADGDDPRPGGGMAGRGFVAFWRSLPGVLTGIAAVLTAVIGLIGLWRSLDDGNGAESSLTGRAATVAMTTGEPGTLSGDVLAEGRLTMRDEDAANLRRKRVSAGDPEADLVLYGAGTPDFATLYAPYGGLFADASGGVDKAGCVEALTTRTRDTVQLVDLAEGSILCLKTHAGTIAALRIVSPPAIGNPQLVFDYTLWP
jgi:hypothetical protein